MKRKFLALLALIGAMAMILSGCSSTRGGSTASASSAGGAVAGQLIGIAMPTKSLERWNKDGAYLQDLLQKAGYKTTLQYADNKVDQQITQIQNMINETPTPKVLVIASIDGTALTPVLQNAKSKGITIFAYDRLINKTPNVDYYATFDNYKVGQLQGNFIKTQVASMTKPINLEAFAGSPDDNNAKFFSSPVPGTFSTP